MTREIRDEDEYTNGSKWFVRWHRQQGTDDDASIDIDCCGYCRACGEAIYFIEATRANGRKTATVLERLGARAAVPVLVVYQDKNGRHPGEILVDNRTAGHIYGWLSEDECWQLLMGLRYEHDRGCVARRKAG